MPLSPNGVGGRRTGTLSETYRNPNTILTQLLFEKEVIEMTDKPIGIKEASKLTGLSTTTLYRGVKDGRLPHYRSGKKGKIYFYPDLLVQAIREEMINTIPDGPQKRIVARRLFGYDRTL